MPKLFTPLTSTSRRPINLWEGPQGTDPMAKSLPPEIWVIILRHTTKSKHPLETSYMSPIEFLRARTGQSALEYKTISTSKRVLVSICRVWYGITLPFLYEDVRLPSGIRGEAFMRALQKSPTDPGRFVKRLSVGSFAADPPEEHELSMILSKMPNLAILSIFYYFPRPLMSTLPPSVASLNCMGFRVDEDEIFDLLNSLPRLEHLNLAPFSNLTPSTSTVSRSLHLPYLHTLDVFDERVASILPSIAQEWKVPRLRHFIGVGAVRTWPACLKANNVQALTYTSAHESASILKAYPNTQDVLYHSHVRSIWIKNPVSFARVAIECTSNSKLTRLRDHFVIFSNPVTYPNLSIIHITGRPLLMPLSRADMAFWMYWIQRWRSKEIRLENDDGPLYVLLPAESEDNDEVVWEYDRFWGVKNTMDFDEDREGSESSDSQSDDDSMLSEAS